MSESDLTDKPRRGKFISFEGGEGVGKSTQVHLLRDQLVGMGIDVVLTREPGGSEGAEEIRQLLVSGDTDKWTPMTEVLLFYAARVDHLKRTILPALSQGKWVITDRYADSTFAYQGAGHGLGQEIIQEIHHITTGDFWPDLTILLDSDPLLGLQRANDREANITIDKREDRFEKLEDSFHNQLRRAYLNIAENNPERVHVVSADGTITEVFNRLWAQLFTILGIK